MESRLKFPFTKTLFSWPLDSLHTVHLLLMQRAFNQFCSIVHKEPPKHNYFQTPQGLILHSETTDCFCSNPIKVLLSEPVSSFSQVVFSQMV